MNRHFVVIFLICCVTASILFTSLVGLDLANAQPIEGFEIPSSMNPVGSGARAIGMGGAFIAVADDATAASWNPGGLIQLETPEVSIVGAYFSRSEDNTFGTNPEASGSQDVSSGELNYLSAAYPFALFNRNMIVSINYQNLYDFNRNWTFDLHQESGSLQAYQDINFEQEGSLSALGLAYAIQIMPQFSFGLTFNYWGNGLYPNGWEQTTQQKGSGTHSGDNVTFGVTRNDEYEFNGFNINLGLLWNISDQLVFGAVFKSPFTADLKHSSSFSYEINFPDSPADDDSGSSFLDENEELDMPMSYGIGLSYRFSDKLTASADIYRTEWEDYVLTDYTGQKISPITGKPVDESNISATTQVRLGVEKLFITNKYIVPIRGGLFYDPAPAEGGSDDFYGISLGSGIALGRFIFDIAYQYRFGNDVGASMAESYDFSQDVNEHTVYFSMIIHL